LRKVKREANLQKLIRQPSGLRARPRTHQESPPDRVAAKSRLPVDAIASTIRLGLFVAVSRDLSCSTAMLISPRLRVSYATHPTRCLIKD
jgi:hypothetical protein